MASEHPTPMCGNCFHSHRDMAAQARDVATTQCHCFYGPPQMMAITNMTMAGQQGTSLISIRPGVLDNDLACAHWEEKQAHQPSLVS